MSLFMFILYCCKFQYTTKVVELGGILAEKCTEAPPTISTRARFPDGKKLAALAAQIPHLEKESTENEKRLGSANFVGGTRKRLANSISEAQNAKHQNLSVLPGEALAKKARGMKVAIS
jgi:hypothetical protein